MVDEAPTAYTDTLNDVMDFRRKTGESLSGYFEALAFCPKLIPRAKGKGQKARPDSLRLTFKTSRLQGGFLVRLAQSAPLFLGHRPPISTSPLCSLIHSTASACTCSRVSELGAEALAHIGLPKGAS